MGSSIFSSIIRLFVVVIALGSAAFLYLGTTTLTKEQANLKSAQKQIKDVDKKLASFRELQKQQLIHAEYALEHQELNNKLQKQGFNADLWLERGLTIEGESVTREEIQGYLMGISKRAGYVFVPSSFVLTTESEKEDLFSWKKGDGENLTLTLNGKYYIRKQ